MEVIAEGIQKNCQANKLILVSKHRPWMEAEMRVRRQTKHEGQVEQVTFSLIHSFTHTREKSHKYK